MAVEVLIVGAGAIGAFYGSRIAQCATARVSAVCRSNYKAVKANGFSVTSPQYGDYKWNPTRTFSSPDEARKASINWDFVVVSTKALPDVTDDSQLLEGLISKSTSIVLIQNGLGVEEPYLKRFPDATILSAVTIASAAQPQPGHIKHNRWTRINVGPYLTDPTTQSESNTQKTNQNTTFTTLLKEGGIKDAIPDTHQTLQLVRWHKIAINAAMNPSAVLSGGTDNNTMSMDPLLQTHLLGVMNEILTTAPKIVGQPFPPSKFASAEQILRSTQKNTSKSFPSMWLDWKDGKRMEIEVILGNPIRLANEKGFSLPRTESMYALLMMAQRNRDGVDDDGKKKEGEGGSKL